MKRNAMKISILDIATYSMTIKAFLSISVAIPSVKIVDLALTGLFIGAVVYEIVAKRYSAKGLFMIGCTALLLLYTTLVTKYSDPMITFMFIVAIKGREINKIIAKIYKCDLLMTVIHFVFTIYGSIAGNLILVNYSRNVYRYNLGFVHANALGAFCFAMIIMYIWLHYKRLKGRNFAFLLLISVVCYGLCKSRTAFLLSILGIILFALAKKGYNAFSNVINFTAKILFPVTAGMIYLITRLYEKGNVIGVLIDNLLTGRINLGAYALDRVGFTLLGRNIDFYGKLASFNPKYNLISFTFDCVYTFIFCSMGLLYLVLFSLLFFKLASKNNVLINISLILWVLYGVTEVACLNGFDFFPIFFSVHLINGRQFLTNDTNERNMLHGRLNNAYYSNLQ